MSLNPRSTLNLANLTFPTGSEWGALIVAYLIGSIPFGYMFARLKGVDLRAIGSGNIGATNTGRALGKPLGFLAFLLDFAKGYLPVRFLAPFLIYGIPSQSALVLVGAAAVIGHCWPVYLGFRGGKGVATGCGAVIALSPMTFVIGGVVFILTALGGGFMSLASIAMAATFVVAAWYANIEGGDLELFWGCLAFAVLVVVRHRSNLARLFAGLEPRWHHKK